jgi:hypothetical protein
MTSQPRILVYHALHGPPTVALSVAMKARRWFKGDVRVPSGKPARPASSCTRFLLLSRWVMIAINATAGLLLRHIRAGLGAGCAPAVPSFAVDGVHLA